MQRCETMLSQKKILVVEDNAINREMLRAILSAEYEVLEAKNGKEALEVLNEFGENISLILLDIVMPVMDGYTFLSVVKENSAYSAIPVIVTTQSDGESDEVTALSHGAADFVAKPYKPQIILHRVASIINLRETAAMINLIQYDRLTGLYSKEFFYQRVKEILIRNPDREYDIVCSDIENFKLVNDAFGIPAGDRLLCDVAALYKDRVGNRGICGRFNADQFACLLEHRWTYTNDLFLEALNQINELTNARNVVMKWGIYRVKGRSASVEQMCDRALLAAQSIKGQYGKYFAEYNDELRNKLLREQAITDEMEQALEQGQFEIYLQPKYRIKDDSLAGGEALVRWNHPKWGIQSPAEFIPLFEKNGFITKLDQYVWDKTCRVLHEWEDKGYPELSVSVNVSRADIYHADLVGILVHTVKKYGLPPSRLHLEITESAYTENPKQIIDTVNNLREQGFVIEMDDFGSGYSSLNMLNDMPIDVLKLDMKFIQNETAKPVNQGILRFIMGLARWMNLSVVAEGVETGEQLERLREIGCDFVQGYFFAKPMPCAEFESLMVPQGGLARQSVSEMGREKQVLLVADENEEYRERVRKTFEARYEVIECSDGAEALEKVAECNRQVTAVILSLELSDGFSALEALRIENCVWNIPVIGTGAADPEVEEMALEQGAADYAAKPHTMKSLWKRVIRVTGFDCWIGEEETLLENEVYRDHLTSLLNRCGLEMAVKELKKEDTPLAFCLFYVGNLKWVNGESDCHSKNLLLKRIGEVLRRHTRKADMVSRFGEDEFVVIMRQLGSEETAVKKGEEICRKIELCAGGVSGKCICGTEIWDVDEPMSEVVERAYLALYRAKSKNAGG